MPLKTIAVTAVVARGMATAGVVLALACGSQEPSGGLPDGKTRVLFIGNSLTYVNDLPAMLTAVARQGGDQSIATASIAFPDFALEDHWNEGSARTALATHRYEFVVLQQGPSSLPENRVYLAEWTERFAPLIRQAGAEPVLYMVWPSSSRQGDFPGVLASYRGAAARVAGLFAPAGDAWLAAWAEDSATPLYGGDGFHPSVAGTYLSALVILGRLTGVDPTTLPDSIPGASSIPPATVQLLQRAAAAALARNPARPTS